jgi:hypothetical protein
LASPEIQPQSFYKSESEHQWGYSIILLFAFLVTTCIMTDALYLVWLGSFAHNGGDSNR